MENILTTATDLKYTGSIKRLLHSEFNNPSDGFVKFLASRVYPRRITQPVLEQFTGIIKEGLAQFIRERLNERLKSALDSGGEPPQIQTQEEQVEERKQNDGIV